MTGNLDVGGSVEFDSLSGTGSVSITNILDEDNMASNSATALATQQSIKAYTDTAIANLVDSSPGSLNTLNELAAALNDDASFSTTITNSIATKLPLAGGTLTGNVNFGDNNKAIFGAGSDLQIYHDGSNSEIINNTGVLNIRNNDIRLKTSGDETSLRAIANGAVELMHNGSTKLATTSTGINVTGAVNYTSGTLNYTGTSVPTGGNNQGLYVPSYAIGLGGTYASLNFPTTSSALTTTAWWMLGRAGGSNDQFTLRVRRGGTAAADQTAYVITTSGADSAKIVDSHKWYTGGSNGTERMRITSDKVQFNVDAKVDADNSHDLGAGGARWKDLYLSGSIANPSGNLTLDASGYINLDTDGGLISLKDGGSEFAQIYKPSAGGLSFWSPQADTDIKFQGSDNGSLVDALTLDMSNGGQAVFSKGASFQDHVYLQDNDKLVLGNSDDLQIYHNNGHAYITNNTGYLHINSANIELKNAANNETMLLATQNGAVKLSYDNSVKLATTSSGVTVTGTVAATSYTGDGSNLTGVGGSTAFGAVGTYGLIGAGAGSGNYTVGETIAGSNLQTAYAVYNFVYDTITAQSGTWRCMGYGGTGYYGTLWVRIS
jgi:hypothetical protein